THLRRRETSHACVHRRRHRPGRQPPGGEAAVAQGRGCGADAAAGRGQDEVGRHVHHRRRRSDAGGGGAGRGPNMRRGALTCGGSPCPPRRWRAWFKELLRTSRVNSTENIAAALAKNPRTAAGNAKVLVNASAVGYYGPHGDEELTEDGSPGDDILAKVCVDWEKATAAAAAPGVRTV